MILIDINTFYNERGGGIRTYHKNKCKWFQDHPEHEYYLFYPGPRHSVHTLSANVTMVSFRGIPVSSHSDGYRLLYDVIGVYRWIRRIKPDVVEVGEPWLSGPFGLLSKALGLYRNPLCAFYHADPNPNYLAPWIWMQRLRLPGTEWFEKQCARFFYWLQDRYDWTLVGSEVVERNLRARGVQRLVLAPLGYDPIFGSNIEIRKLESPGSVKFLHVGRLERDRGVDLLEALMPELLEVEYPQGTLRVVGFGPQEAAFREWKHPRYAWQGYVSDRQELANIYTNHHILLAPGPFDTFGLTVLEALTSGLVVVGPDTGGVGEMLKNGGSPFIFRAGDVQDFRRAIRAAANAVESDLEAEIRRSRAIAQRYGTWNEAIGRIIDFYQTKVIKKS